MDKYAIDEYFVEAGRIVIEKDKASIGILQRKFKIGFNRASRIMEQLCDFGVVGDEEGTRPRRILMDKEEFERLISDFDNVLKEIKLEKLERNIDNLTRSINKTQERIEKIKKSYGIMKEIATKILFVFYSFNIHVELKNITAGLDKTVFGIEPNIGIRVKRIMSYKQEIEIALECRIEMKLEPEKGYIGIYIPTDYIINKID